MRDWIQLTRPFLSGVAAGYVLAGAYLSAGVDITKTLSSLESQFARTALGPVIGRLRAGVKKGEAIAEIAAREPKTFDPLFISMIKLCLAS